MNKHILILLALVLYVVPTAHAQEATSTPEIEIVSEPAASTTPEVPPEEEVASTTPPADEPISALPDPVSITLIVAMPTATLFDAQLEVEACAASAADAPSVSGFCALEQAGLSAQWSWWGSDAFLDSLGGTGNDYTAGIYWMWFEDLEMGGVALNKHSLTTGETLLVTLGVMPLKLQAQALSPAAGATTTLTALAFGFDAAYTPVWLPATGAHVTAGALELIADEQGQVAFITPAEPLSAQARKDGFIPSPILTLQPSLAPSAPEQEEARTTGGGRSLSPADEALSFLLAQQHEDGSFGKAMLGDWAALAFAAARAPQEAVQKLARSLGTSGGLSSVTDYERRAMALLALGENPYAGGSIGHIVSGFDGAQMGGPLINDDIFALLPLVHAGYRADDPLIQAIVAHILAAQEQDGSWRYPEMTSAALQALAPLGSVAGVPGALARAKSSLRALQTADGCIGNAYATSWALQAIAALKESHGEWRAASGNSPRDCLMALQGEDGGFEEGADDDSRIWATAYALPALVGKPWDKLMGSVSAPKQKEKPAQAGGTRAGEVLGTSTAVVSPVSETPAVPVVSAVEPATPQAPGARPTAAVPPAPLPAPQEEAVSAPAYAYRSPSMLSRLWTTVWQGIVSLFSAVL